MWYDVFIVAAGALAGLGAILCGRRMAAGPVYYVGAGSRREGVGREGGEDSSPCSRVSPALRKEQLAAKQREAFEKRYVEEQMLQQELISLVADQARELYDALFDRFEHAADEIARCERCGEAYPTSAGKCPRCPDITPRNLDEIAHAVAGQIEEHSRVIAQQGRAMDEMEKRIRRLEERSSRERLRLTDETGALPKQPETVH